MQIRVLWLGHAARDPFRLEVQTYVERVRRRWPCEDVQLKPHRGGRDDDPRRAVAHEAETLTRALPVGWATVALDEHGREVDSDAFAHLLAERERLACPGVAFLVGSDLGLAASVRDAADSVVSLSRLTLPHLVARLVLWEQVFRAVHILAGGAYHRQGVQ